MDKQKIFYWIAGIVCITITILLLRTIVTDVINESLNISNTILIIFGFILSIVYISKATRN